MDIPIQNIYYLLCYAWDRLEEGETVDVTSIDSTELVDLFAHVLISGIRHLARRGLERGYETFSEDLAAIRGRVDVARSARRMLLQHGKADCSFDELTVNTLNNQIIKSTLNVLYRSEEVDPALRKQGHELFRQLHAIDVIPLTRLSFRKIQLHSNNRYYRFLLDVCRLIAESLLVDETSGSYRFRDFTRDQRKMARLFESFIFNFIKIERRDLGVRKEKISWDAQSFDEESLYYLPKMETDVSVRNSQRTLIIDAKYYRDTFSTYYESESIHSANLYQLFSYLKNLEARGGNDKNASGLLIYPEVDQTIDLSYRIQGHDIAVKTLNLAADWHVIRDQLRKIVSIWFPPNFSLVESSCLSADQSVG